MFSLEFSMHKHFAVSRFSASRSWFWSAVFIDHLENPVVQAYYMSGLLSASSLVHFNLGLHMGECINEVPGIQAFQPSCCDQSTFTSVIIFSIFVQENLQFYSSVRGIWHSVEIQQNLCKRKLVESFSKQPCFF